MSWIVRTLLLYAFGVHIAATSSTPTSPARNEQTCPSRTVNYLTHTLPQQCLASSRGTVPPQTASEHPSGAADATLNASSGEHASVTISTGTKLDSSALSSATHDAHSTRVESPVSVTTVTAVEVPNNALIPAVVDIIENESPLEDNFLSFEEWKVQNLKSSGQSEHVARGAKFQSRGGQRPRPNVQSPLDSLGDDAEIDIHFTGFGQEGVETLNQASGQASEGTGSSSTVSKSKADSRKKQAGTTSKERFNYASFDCAASILKTNSKAKSPSSVLVENKDAYMLNECAAQDKFLILELCNDLEIDTIVLANFEFFSSIFRLFRVSVSDRYPVKADKWKPLGVFEARNTREVQAFLIEDPVMWARYMRIDFLTHYGSEFYCPVSLVRVHGTTMMEDWKKDQQAAHEDDDDAENDIETEGAESITEPQEPAFTNASDPATASTEMGVSPQAPSPETSASNTQAITDQDHHPVSTAEDQNQAEQSQILPVQNASSDPQYDAKLRLLPLALDRQICAINDSYITTDDIENLLTQPTAVTQALVPASTGDNSKDKISSQEPVSIQANDYPSPVKPQVANDLSATSSSLSDVTNSTVSTVGKPASAAAEPMRTPATPSNHQKSQPSAPPERSRQPASSQTQSQPASPTMQESFFKSVQKRLQMLESNSSLSLQYIEEQSKALRDAFRKAEQRQLAKTTIFLDHLNATVLHELREFRQQYDQLWQSTVIELEIQRERWQRENQAMHARLGVLADELIFQKRLSILQMFLIIICLGLVLFSRGAINNYLELPLVQSVLSRSGSTRWMSLSGDSSSNAPPLKRTRSAHTIRGQPSGILKTHKRMQSNESNTAETLSPIDTEIYSPPTPVSYDGFSDTGHSTQDESKINGGNSDVEFDPSTIERPSTSPPTLTARFEQDPIPLRSVEEFERDSDRNASIDSRLLSPSARTERKFRWPYHYTSSPASSVEGFGSSPRSSSKQLKWDLPEK